MKTSLIRRSEDEKCCRSHSWCNCSKRRGPAEWRETAHATVAPARVWQSRRPDNPTTGVSSQLFPMAHRGALTDSMARAMLPEKAERIVLRCPGPLLSARQILCEGRKVGSATIERNPWEVYLQAEGWKKNSPAALPCEWKPPPGTRDFVQDRAEGSGELTGSPRHCRPSQGWGVRGQKNWKARGPPQPRKCAGCEARRYSTLPKLAVWAQAHLRHSHVPIPGSPEGNFLILPSK